MFKSNELPKCNEWVLIKQNYSDPKITLGRFKVEDKDNTNYQYWEWFANTINNGRNAPTLICPGAAFIEGWWNYINESTFLKEHKCKIYSCFVATGKTYAMNYLSKQGYKVRSIEKYNSFYDIYPTAEDYIDKIISLSSICDILFIPYYLGMNKGYLKDSGIDYTIIYPDRHLRSLYHTRILNMYDGFAYDYLNYFADSFDDMIDDIESSNCRKIKLGKDDYALDKIKEDLKNV